MNENFSSSWDSVFSELEREKNAIEEVLSAFRAFQGKLAHLPPHLGKRVAAAIGQTYQGPEKENEQVTDDKATAELINPRPDFGTRHASEREAEDKAKDEQKSKSLSNESALPADVAGGEAANSASETSLAEMTALECARRVLADHYNKPMHYGEIAKEALRRGYVGQSPDDASSLTAREHRLAKSFWAMMHRATAVFEKTGADCYRLRIPQPDVLAAAPDEPRGQSFSSSGPLEIEATPSLSKQIVNLLRNRGQRMRGSEIAKALELEGVTTNAVHGLVAMVLSALRKRGDLFVRYERGVYGLTEWEKTSDQAAGEDVTDSDSPEKPDGDEKDGFWDERELGQATGNDLANLNMLDAAAKILAESGHAMHYKHIAKEAVNRGYSSGRGTTFNTLCRSFWSLLHRNCFRPDSRFRMIGGGVFDLKET